MKCKGIFGRPLCIILVVYVFAYCKPYYNQEKLRFCILFLSSSEPIHLNTSHYSVMILWHGTADVGFFVLNFLQDFL